MEKKSIVAGFTNAGLTFGDFLSHKDIDFWSGLSFPMLTDISNQADLQDAMKQYSLKRLCAVESLKEYALTQRNMLLMPVRGEGYRIAEPAEQTDLVAQQGMRTIRKGLRNIERGIEFVEVSRLTGSEREYRNSARSRLQGLSLMLGRSRDLLPAK